MCCNILQHRLRSNILSISVTYVRFQDMEAEQEEEDESRPQVLEIEMIGKNSHLDKVKGIQRVTLIICDHGITESILEKAES